MKILCQRLVLCIDPSKIGFMRFVLEGYDGMAYMTTLEAQRGLVEVCYIPSFRQDLFTLLGDLCCKIRRQRP